MSTLALSALTIILAVVGGVIGGLIILAIERGR